MFRPFATIILQIDEALQSKDLIRAGRLFLESAEVASQEGMITGPRGEELMMWPRKGRPNPGPSEILDVGTAIGLLIEDTGHKIGDHSFVHQAEHYLTLLMKYATQSLLSDEQRYRMLKPRLMRYIQSGAYHGALILALAALEGIKNDHPLEMITMYFDLGSIYVHLERLKEAHDFYRTALDLALRHDAPEVMVNVIRKNLHGITTGYDPDFLFLPDQTQVTDAARVSESDTVPDLLRRGYEMNARDASGNNNLASGRYPPIDAARLADAARAGEFDTVLDLLRRGYEMNARDAYGSTALIYAVSAHNEEVVNALLDHGANVNLADSDGRTALFYSLLFSCPISIVKRLIEHGADVGLEDRARNTALMVATSFPSAGEYKREIIKLLRNAAKQRM